MIHNHTTPVSYTTWSIQRHVHFYSALFRVHLQIAMDLQVVLGLNDLQSRFSK